MRSKRFEPIQEIASTSATDLSRAMAEAGRRVAELERLGEAMRQHVTKLDHARAEYDKRRELWSEKRTEAESLGRAIDRFRKEEQYVAEQREQREGDDAAMRIALTAKGDSTLR